MKNHFRVDLKSKKITIANFTTIQTTDFTLGFTEDYINATFVT